MKMDEDELLFRGFPRDIQYLILGELSGEGSEVYDQQNLIEALQTYDREDLKEAASRLIKRKVSSFDEAVYILSTDSYDLPYAAGKGYISLISYIVENYPEENFDGALRWASSNGHIDIVRLLLEAGADVHANEDYALCMASYNGHIEIVRLLLLEAGAHVHVDEDYALRWASYNGHIDIVRLLLEAGADVHSRQEGPLYFAVDNGHIGIVELLLEAGANVTDDIIQLALRKGYVEILSLLRDTNQY